jgi:hypothetical protein
MVRACAFLLWMSPAVQSRPLEFPYRSAGLSQTEAAAHLLNRLAYGPRPDEMAEVCKMGLEAWTQRQLVANQSLAELDKRLKAPAASDEGSLRQAKLVRAVYKGKLPAPSPQKQPPNLANVVGLLLGYPEIQRR